MNIYSNKFENLVIYVGGLPAGKTLNVDATDKNLQRVLEEKQAEWLEKYPAPSEESRNFVAWDDCRRADFVQIATRLLESEEWYENAYVWEDAS